MTITMQADVQAVHDTRVALERAMRCFNQPGVKTENLTVAQRDVFFGSIQREITNARIAHYKAVKKVYGK